MAVYSNILEMVGKTPMLEVTHLDTGPCRLFLKLELLNPGGSVKDRIGISMIERAEAAAAENEFFGKVWQSQKDFAEIAVPFWAGAQQSNAQLGKAFADSLK